MRQLLFRAGMNSTHQLIQQFASGKDTKVILVSTVNKLNHFNSIRVKAERGENEFVPF